MTVRAYAGHTDKTGPATATYIKADLAALAAALAALTGLPYRSRSPAPSAERSVFASVGHDKVEHTDVMPSPANSRPAKFDHGGHLLADAG